MRIIELVTLRLNCLWQDHVGDYFVRFNQPEKKSKDALKKAELAIRILRKEGREINFSSVSRAAGVSVPWCYNNSEIRQKIAEFRENQPMKKIQIPKSERPSEASREGVITGLKLRISELVKENCELRKQVEIAYGQLETTQKIRKVETNS